MEEALYEIPLLRRFVGVDLGRDFVPDETTILKFRRLLERHDLARAIFEEVHTGDESHQLYVRLCKGEPSESDRREAR
jgi:IS5 family transposase